MTTPLEVFRPGTHTAMSGATLSFGEADLAACAQAYDPAKHEAPLVVGHPQHDDPAYGWVKSLAFAEGGLQADPQQVDEGFAEMVKAGRFKKISASFYTPDSPANPVPGVYYLRHVGFLGAQAPAVKGMRKPTFDCAAQEEGVVSFGDFSDLLEAGMWRRLRDWFIGKFGLEEADQVLPSWDIDHLKTLAEAPDEPAPASIPAFAEEDRMQKEEFERREAALKAREEELAQADAKFAERLQALEARDKDARKADALAFCDGLVKGGQLAPTRKDEVVAFMSGLDPDGSISFGEGDQATSKPTLTWFKGFLSDLPKRLEFGEAAPREGEASASLSFAAAPGCSVDAAGLELHAKALAYQEAHPEIPYLAAVKAVSKEA